MLYKIQQLRTLMAYKNSHHLGDFALLKADLLGAKAHPAIAPQLNPLIGYHPTIDLDALSQYPSGSFGRAYADHMHANQLQPLSISPDLEDVARRNVFALRYAVTHDIFHVLLGFDTSYAGEIGVLAFAVGQRYSRAQAISLAIARWLYPLLAPQQTQQIAALARQGQVLGEQAQLLLAVKFEECWQEPLDSLRARLNLPSVPDPARRTTSVS